MTVTAVDRNTPASYLQRQMKLLLAASAVVPAGVIVCVTTAGTVPNTGFSDAAGAVVMGRSEHAASQTAGDVSMNVSKGVYGFAASAALIALAGAPIGSVVYGVDNQTVGLTSDTVNSIPVGVLEEIEGGVYYVAVGLGLGSGNITNAETTLPIADGALSPTTLDGGVEIVIPIAIPDAATQTYSYKTTSKIEIIGLDVLKDGANVAGTIQLTDGADAAITDAIAAATDKAITRAGTIDVAKRILAAGATFKIIATRAGVKMTALVLLRAIKRS